jgi:phosphate starvation-inducible PhoH-like protein
MKPSKRRASTSAEGEPPALSTAAEPHLEIAFEDDRLFHDLLGSKDENLRAVERALGVRIVARGGALAITGDDVSRELAGRVLSQLYGLLERGIPSTAVTSSTRCES